MINQGLKLFHANCSTSGGHNQKQRQYISSLLLSYLDILKELIVLINSVVKLPNIIVMVLFFRCMSHSSSVSLVDTNMSFRDK